MRRVQNAIGFDKQGELPFRCLNYSPIKEAFANAVLSGGMTRENGVPNHTSLFEYLGDKITSQPSTRKSARHHIFRRISDRQLKFIQAPQDYKPTLKLGHRIVPADLHEPGKVIIS